MIIAKEIFGDLQEKFTKVIKLITDDTKLDTETEPFKSKYAAREILLEMKTVVEELLDKGDTKFKAILGAILLYLGIVTIDVEELPMGEKYLEQCKQVINDIAENPECIIITLNMYNQFGILWSQREAEKSRSYLEEAEQLYKKYKAANVAPIDIPNLFDQNMDNDSDMAWINYEKTHTFTLYYLAQIYGTLKDALKSSIYCHNTLKRQLKSGDFDPIDWALNAATLSMFFIEKNGFKQARHHLAASSHTLDQYEEQLDRVEVHDELFDSKVETLKHRSADVARCWAKYGLLLLSQSKERLLSRTDDIESTDYPSVCEDLAMLTLEPNSTVSQDDLQHLDFEDLDLSKYECQITYKFVLTIQDARLVFLNIQNWLRKAATYYTLENLASDHIEIVQDQSQMYLNLLFFEDSPDTQAKLHKRRIDLLEGLIKEISPQYYLPYCRKIWFELGQAYSDILNIKADKLKETDAPRPTPHALAKINHLAEKSVFHFNTFIESFKDERTNEKISDDYEVAYLQAFLHVAALNSKFITLDKKVQLENVEKSRQAYETVQKYCEKNEKAKELIPVEYGMCKEMLAFLPVKIAKLKREIGENAP